MGEFQWFASPDTTDLDLGDGKWIRVKNELTAQAEKKITLGAIRGMNRHQSDEGSPSEYSLDHDALAFGKVLAYLVDWNLPNPITGKSMDCTRDNIMKLTGAAFERVRVAIETHIEQRDVEKKLQNGERPSGASSPSVV